MKFPHSSLSDGHLVLTVAISLWLFAWLIAPTKDLRRLMSLHLTMWMYLRRGCRGWMAGGTGEASGQYGDLHSLTGAVNGENILTMPSRSPMWFQWHRVCHFSRARPWRMWQQEIPRINCLTGASCYSKVGHWLDLCTTELLKYGSRTPWSGPSEAHTQYSYCKVFPLLCGQLIHSISLFSAWQHQNRSIRNRA